MLFRVQDRDYSTGSSTDKGIEGHMKKTLRITNDDVAAEIARLHQFFIDWFNGVVPKTTEEFAKFSDATSDEFVMVPPSGAMVGIKQLAQGLFNAHNQRPGLDIAVKKMKVQHQMGDFYLATYEEWQLEKGETEWKGRVSSALLSVDESAPAGLMWHHVHETWLP